MKHISIALSGILLVSLLLANSVVPKSAAQSSTVQSSPPPAQAATIWLDGATPEQAGHTAQLFSPQGSTATVSFISGNETDVAVNYPNADDYVDVIVQVKGIPLSSYIVQQRGMFSTLSDGGKGAINKHDQEIKTFRDGVKAEAAKQKIDFRGKREYAYVFNGLAGAVKQKDLDKLSKLPGVEAVFPDRKVHIDLSESVPLMGATQVTDSQGNPVKGDGIKVAVVDTGIDYSLPSLGAGFGPGYKVIGGWDFASIPEDANPMDDHGHGTHVAGIVASSHATYTGVAPNASLLAYKVLDATGSGSASDVISGIERAVLDGADIINLSLGDLYNPYDPMAQAVNNAVDQGVIVAAAAGNSGSNFKTINSPGAADKAIAVGASSKADSVASFSSRGPVPGTSAIKPDILAPGVSIKSTVPTAGPLGDPTGFKSLSGTSMATPHIAGAAALLKQLHPAWNPEEIKSALMNTALNLGYSAYIQGAGRVQVNKAATTRSVLTPGSLSLGVDDRNQPTWQVSRSLTLNNKSSTTLTYDFSIAPGLPVGITAGVTPTSATVAAGGQQTVTFNISVDNTIVSPPSAAPYSYEGVVLAQARSGSEVLRVPFAFTDAPTLTLNFDQQPWTVFIHDRVSKTWLYTNPGASLSVALPPGTYDVVATYPDSATQVFKEGVAVTSATTVSVAKTDALYNVTVAPVDEKGNPLAVANGVEKITYKDTGISQTFLGSFATQKHVSAISSNYSWEWVATTGIDSSKPVYDINGYANNGISAHRTFQNSPADFKHLTWEYNPPPGVDQLLIRHWISPGPGGGQSYSQSAFGETPLAAPFKREEYYTPIPYADFSFGYFYEDVFARSATPYDPAQQIYLTPFMVARNSSTVEGYQLGAATTPVFSTTSSLMPLGLSPPHWSGRFSNTTSKIVLGPASGVRTWPFLSQLQDLRLQGVQPYQLYKRDAYADVVVANSASNTVSVLLNNGAGSILSRTDYPTGNGPSAVAVADLNGDGRSDVVVADSLDNKISVLLNDGAGFFLPEKDYAVGNLPSSVAVADLNGDTRPDVVVANQTDNTVSVLLNDGNGVFSTRVDYDVGTAPVSVAIIDVDGASGPDLIVGNSGSGNVSVLLNNGSGAFPARADYQVGLNPASVAVGYLNADSRPDIVVASRESNTISVLLNNGDGTFPASKRSDYDVGTDPRAVVVADLNADPRSDIVVANSGSNSVSVLLNAGDGTFPAKTDYPVGNSPSSLATADLNGDFMPDVISGNSGGNNISVLLNNGDGTSYARTDYVAGNGPAAVAIGLIDNSLVQSGSLAGTGNPTSPTSVEVLLSSGGIYTFSTSYDQYSIKGQQGAASVTATFNTQATNKNPPYLSSLNLLSNGEAGDTLNAQGANQVKFKMSDDNGLGRVSLYYKVNGNWNELPLTISGDEYAATLPSPLPTGFLSLKIFAGDTSGNSLVYQVTPAAAIRSISSHVFSTGWNMFSPPLSADPSSLQTQMEQYISPPLNIYAYNPQLQGYQMNPATIDLGQGYWVKTLQDKTVQVEGVSAPTVRYNSVEYYTIRLFPGWNLVGNPFNAPIALKDILARNLDLAGSPVVTWAEAVTSTWLSGFVYAYNSVAGSYVMLTAPDGVLEPWDGYWVKAMSEIDLMLPLAVAAP